MLARNEIEVAARSRARGRAAAARAPPRRARSRTGSPGSTDPAARPCRPRSARQRTELDERRLRARHDRDLAFGIERRRRTCMRVPVGERRPQLGAARERRVPVHARRLLAAQTRRAPRSRAAAAARPGLPRPRSIERLAVLRGRVPAPARAGAPEVLLGKAVEPVRGRFTAPSIGRGGSLAPRLRDVQDGATAPVNVPCSSRLTLDRREEDPAPGRSSANSANPRRPSSARKRSDRHEIGVSCAGRVGDQHVPARRNDTRKLVEERDHVSERNQVEGAVPERKLLRIR